MFKGLIAVLTALANAYTASQHNKLLRMIEQNGKDIYLTTVRLYELEDSASGDTRTIDLVKLRLQFLEQHRERLFAASGRTSPKVADTTGDVPPRARPVSEGDGGGVDNTAGGSVAQP